MKGLAVLLLLFLLSASSPAFASKTFGDWVVVRSSNGDMVAATFEDNGKYILGFRCYKSLQSCLHILDIGTDCTEGHSYPVLVNSDYHSLAMTAVCTKHNRLALPKYDAIHDILEHASVVAFAVPMASGLIKVVRFSLSGSTNAMKYAEKRVNDNAVYK